jgi:hypothetical protein
MFRVTDSWWLDVKLGVRMLVKYPGLALAGGAGIAVAVAIAAGDSALSMTTFWLPAYPSRKATGSSRSRFGTRWHAVLNRAFYTITTSGAKS